MTTKEIAEAVGKEERTIRRWISKLPGLTDKMSVSSPMNPADFLLEETCAIIETGMGKNAADLFRMSARKPTENKELVTRGDLAAFGAAIVSEMMKQFLPLLQNPIQKMERPVQIQIEAPKLETRDELRRLVAKAGRASGDYPGTWSLLYQEIYYRIHRNVRECAKNRGIDTLDYIESEGLLPEAIAIAREVFR